VETTPLYLKKSDKLKEALKNSEMDFIPSNVVLDKTLPGVGATYTEIHAKRHSIIIEPNVPVIRGKVKSHHELDLFPVLKGVTVKKVEKYLSDSTIKYKKLLTTPEGFRKIEEAAKNLKINLHADFFCLFDECERLTQDVGYRKNISNPIKDFFDFTSKAFVSATPLDIHHPEIKEQRFKRLKIVPLYDYKENLQLIVTNDMVNVLMEKLYELKYSQCICIFFNSTMGIGSIVQSLRLYNYKIFCSEEGQIKLSKQEIKNVETDFTLPHAQYNFFTSRFFSAVDIELNIKPDIIIYTDLKQAEHTIIDPYSEAIQIQGRFRKYFDGKRFNSLTHISNIKSELRVKTEEELDYEIEFYRTHYKFLSEKKKEKSSEIISEAIDHEIQKTTYSRLLDKDGNLDDFAVHNLYNEERVKSYYTSAEALRAAYLGTDFFNLDFKKDFRFNLEEERFTLKKTIGKKKKIIRLVSLLQTAPDIEELRKAVSSDFAEVDLIINAFKNLCLDFIVKVDYSLAKIRKKMAEYESNEKRFFCVAILFEIADKFELGVKQDKNIYKAQLQEIYNRYGIIQKATQDTITEYFQVRTDNGIKPATFELVKFIRVIGSKIT